MGWESYRVLAVGVLGSYMSVALNPSANPGTAATQISPKLEPHCRQVEGSVLLCRKPYAYAPNTPFPFFSSYDYCVMTVDIILAIYYCLCLCYSPGQVPNADLGGCRGAPLVSRSERGFALSPRPT